MRSKTICALQADLDDVERENAFISHMFVNGSECDLSGVHRTSEVCACVRQQVLLPGCLLPNFKQRVLAIAGSLHVRPGLRKRRDVGTRGAELPLCRRSFLCGSLQIRFFPSAGSSNRADKVPYYCHGSINPLGLPKY